MEARAFGKNLPVTPRKAQLVADLVRNQNVNIALDILDFTPKVAAKMIKKLISSARANALYQDPNVDDMGLYVKRILVADGVMLKRIRPRARGMAYRIRRRRCHITVILDEKREEDVNN